MHSTSVWQRRSRSCTLTDQLCDGDHCRSRRLLWPSSWQTVVRPEQTAGIVQSNMSNAVHNRDNGLDQQVILCYITLHVSHLSTTNIHSNISFIILSFPTLNKNLLTIFSKLIQARAKDPSATFLLIYETAQDKDTKAAEEIIIVVIIVTERGIREMIVVMDLIAGKLQFLFSQV